MSTTDGVGVPKLDRNPRVVQIHPRVSQNTAAYCPLQISSGDTARTVIRNALVTLGLDDSRTYSLLEVRDSGQEERPLEPSDCLLERVRLWPPETQRWHPETQGYYFVLQQTDSGAPEDGDRIDDYDDLCSLQAVSEASILEALCQRFYRLKIYTYAGNILIAINPNKFLPVYYNPKYIKMYEKQPLGKLSPHIFAVADAAFRAMLDNQVNQCIVMHGDSGSGKTESSSYLIHCLTALSEKTCSVGLKRTILGAVPVLQAFGNARTSENNNSSRFGKFIQLNYLESGVIRGAVIEKWLLEKSRLVSRDKNERNYHVFYYLLMGASRDEQEDFHLLKPQDYFYLNQGDLHLDDDSNFGQEYKRLKQAMEMVGFLASTKKHIFSVLSAILLLGNVSYTLAEDTKVLEVGPAEVLSTLSDLLKVKVDLLTKALTKRKLVVANTTVESQYTLHEASRVRDTMAKSLYSALFEWIVLHINHAMLNRRDMEESVSGLSIGILDMFGFENLQKNTFEQLCINYSNEKLQYYINQHIFKFKQEDYVSEGITWQNIDFADNSGCIQFIGEKPSGLFDLLDQELPWATAKTLLDKLKQLHQDDPFLVTSSNADGTFVIQHFAGRVKYHIQDFRRENNEHMPPEVVSLLRSSEQSFFHHLVASSPEALFRWGVLRATIRIIAVFKSMGRHRAELIAARKGSRSYLKDRKQCSSGLERLSSNSLTLDFSFDRSDDLPLDVFEDIFTNYENRKKSRSGRQKQLIPKNLMDYVSLQHVVGLTAHDQTSKLIYRPHRTAKVPTYSTQVQASLNKLMARIEKAEPFFIFCIRSNDQKKELHFDSELVLQQIKHMGITQMVHIQKSGYSAKYTFKEFVEKFRLLLPKGATEAPEHIKELFERMEINKSSYQIGKTKVFLKEKERQLLRDTLTKEVMRRIIILQRWFRTCLIRLHFLQRRDATTIIQRSWREYYEKKNRAATVIQSAWVSCLKRSPGQPPSQPRLGRDSLTKKGLRRQQHVEVSPNRIQNPDPTCSRSAQRDRSKEKCEGRGSPPPLNRPLSLPLDPKVCIGNQSSRPITTYKEKQSDDSSPDMQRWADTKKDFKFKGKSMSADELSMNTSSGSDSSPSSNTVRVRFRKQPKRKRRLAYPRSGLIVNFGGSKESEYWSFPLPPISPHVSAMKSSASSVDVRAHKSQVKIPAELDGTRFSFPARTADEDLGQQSSSQSQLTSPERIWFLSKFLRKRAPKYSPNNSPSDHPVTLPRYTTQSYHSSHHNSERVKRNPTIRISRATRVMESNASLDREITDPQELQNLDEFLGNQVYELRTRIKELSPTESVFLTATMQFRQTIKEMYSLKKPKIGYKDLMKGYHNKVNTLAGSKSKTEVSLVINLFQSVLDGFIRGELKRLESEPAKATKTTKKRKKKDKCLASPLDHRFSTYQVSIMQSCDLCGSYIWGMEKAYMCSACKLICHKKCLNKIITDCSTRRARQDESTPGSLHFGVQVYMLTSKANPVPKVIEMLLMHVEINGLYTEGLYRKSGSACRAKELHQILETTPESACLDNYVIHTITGLVKRWLRELPDPLMTFDLYTDFLHAAELPDRAEKIRAVYQKVDELPPANYNTLERLIFHLVRVAKEEEHNKMSPSSLAIVFAPCILRSPDVDNPFLSMKDVPRTTACVEILITEQFRRYKEKMQNIQELEYAEALAVHQLKLRRQNTIVEKPSELDIPQKIDSDETERTLIERIRSIKQEKEDLTCRLPELEQENSDNEILDSASSMSSESLEDRLGSVDSEGKGSSKHLKHHLTPKSPDVAQPVMEAEFLPCQDAPPQPTSL
ncbi:unconventional myosin-IXb-like isoform X1 [Takifugu flavidus]|uniref:unconventional myosin-IXb-like isoform X1 n=1 Tax=Takifugu flavidus TaxID=433684 RepID=UPI002544D01F|nr:unconventional myosin-IXb-like isoform X1 [Takifugu flavidus]